MKYDSDFRKRAVNACKERPKGVTIKKIAADFKVGEGTLHAWIAKAKKNFTWELEPDIAEVYTDDYTKSYIKTLQDRIGLLRSVIKTLAAEL